MTSRPGSAASAAIAAIAGRAGPAQARNCRATEFAWSCYGGTRSGGRPGTITGQPAAVRPGPVDVTHAGGAWGAQRGPDQPELSLDGAGGAISSGVRGVPRAARAPRGRSVKDT